MSIIKPVVDTGSGDLPEQTDEAWAALMEWANADESNPRVVARSNVLMKMDDIDGLVPFKEPQLKDAVGRAADFTVPLKSGGDKKIYPPKDIVQTIMHRGFSDWPGVKQVERVTEVPVATSEGDVISEPGLHESGIWYRPRRELAQLHEIVREPDTVDNVRAARDLLLEELLGDFDFVDDASRANALGLVLLPFVRELIGESPTPLHLIIAPQPGSGKTYLAQACLIPGCGIPDISSEPRDDDELRKRITARLIGASPSIIFDNLSRSLASATLAAILTTPIWSDRVLGGSTEISVGNRLIYVATGNNTDTSPELRDRVCPIWLAPRDGLPARQRSSSDFRHPDLRRWAVDHRAELASACLTLVSHWLQGQASRDFEGGWWRDADARTGSHRSMGSFERWAGVIGGILAAADVHEFLGNLDHLETVDVEGNEIAEFFAQIARWRASTPIESQGLADDEFRLRDLVTACGMGGALAEWLPEDLDPRPAGLKMSLKWWLHRHRNATHGGLTLRARDNTGGGTNHYRIEQR